MAVLALAGLACIAWVAAAAIFGLSLITFATGSMAPTIPTGSLGIVREIPASELKVGDVATLQRGGEPLPITHRVLSVEQSPTDPSLSIVTMQGDANPIPDVFPYYVDTAKVVLWSAPGGAYVTRALSHPLVIGGVTLGIGTHVLWAFWPKKPRTAGAAHSDTNSTDTDTPNSDSSPGETER
jgi:signal peptidase